MRTIAVATRLNYTCQWATQAQFLGGQDGPSSSLVSTVLQAPVPIQLEDRVPAVAHFTMSLLVGSGPDTIPPTDGVPVVKPTKARVLSVSSLSY
ncbi:uncharacterized protein ACA1_167450 [Acanthamoeba castellanii str. Neff]|uniref:Uncharacterized protein n=1 Tax=Acanthamoeba castellanii (strain ATCC 30010 / Neff) TaxID=1257118 RepID=L8GU47_ACACF|nr:uncharacterized protein ACA1_167450 [Acanthamoeba castellanii str. Neff]ELR16535.1 hypothetical protein ACA1_167450 [Acanthamoeba castellanii str. Neff]